MPHPVDAYVGARVKLRRKLIGLSQEKLGESLGLTFQQVQKYERGANRIGASRLYHLSILLDVPVSYFFDGYADDGNVPPGDLTDSPPDTFEHDPQHMSRRDTIDLLRVFYQVPPGQARRRLIDLIRSFADLWPAARTSVTEIDETGKSGDEDDEEVEAS